MEKRRNGSKRETVHRIFLGIFPERVATGRFEIHHESYFI